MIKILLVALGIMLALSFVFTKQMATTAPNEADSVSTQESEAQLEEDRPESRQSSGETTTTTSEEPILSAGASLDLSGQGLTKVPESVFSRTSLESLDVSNNNLTGSLQAEVRQLQNLKVLDLSNNQFTGVPAEVGQLSNLEVLDLSNNELTGLPYELANLSNLKVLKLKGNDYSTADLAVIKQNLSATTIIETE